MKISPTLFVVVGCLFLLAAIVIRFVILPGCGGIMPYIRPASLLILANTSFILALLLKKQ